MALSNRVHNLPYVLKHSLGSLYDYIHTERKSVSHDKCRMCLRTCVCCDCLSHGPLISGECALVMTSILVKDIIRYKTDPLRRQTLCLDTKQ